MSGPQSRSVLFIDDEWGIEGNLNIPGKFASVFSDPQLNVALRTSTAATPQGLHSVDAAIASLRAIPDLALVVLDIMFTPDGPRLGIEILGAIRERWPRLPVVMLTSIDSDDDIEPLESAMGLGASDYVCKAWPAKVASDILISHLRPMPFNRRPVLWGISPTICDARRRIVRAAHSGANILITGESGTGKELVARAVYNLGPRRSGPFVAHNIGAKDSSLIEADLFGHVKGAFTGAVSNRKGLFEAANGGVLFLDEVAAMPRPVQVRLLRVLETHSFSRVGETEEIAVDFQLVCASSEPLARLVGSGLFREDILYRLDEVAISLPPLRERREDIPLLADVFLDESRLSARAPSARRRLSPGALAKLKAYAWPGNVRQLRNVLRRACIFSNAPTIAQDEVVLSDPSPQPPLAPLTPPTTGRQTVDGCTAVELPSDSRDWPRHRQQLILQLLLEARRRCSSNAEFVNRMFPAARNDDLRRALAYVLKSPYGACTTGEFAELHSLQQELESYL